MRLLSFVVLFIYSAVCFSQKINYTSLVTDKNLIENADAIVRLDELVVDIIAQDNMVLTSKRVVTVLNKNGNKHINAFVGYSSSNKIKNIKALVYDSFGNEIKKLKEKDFKDVSAVSGGTLFSDYRVKYLDYTPTQYPYTIVLEKEIQTPNTVFVPEWNFLDDYRQSLEKSSFVINYANANLKPAVLEKNFGDYAIEKKETPLSISYLATNISAIKWEELSPDFNVITPKVMSRLVNFHYEGINGHVENWGQLGEWMHNNILKGRGNLSLAVKEKVRNLVKDAATDLEKAKIVYEYMQSVTRYISVQVGIGGVQPILASEVDRLKYGDCKGLSNYTKSLLEAVGVNSYYVHVEAGSDKINFEDDFPTLSQGNHAILAIPNNNNNNYTWIDCTSQIHPFGFIGDFTDDRKVLVIKPTGGEIVKTTAYLEKNNEQLIKSNIQLLNNGAIKVKAVIETQGIQYDNRFYLEDKDRDKVLEHYQDVWSSINNIELEDYSFNNNKEKVKFTENVKITAENYTRLLGSRILFTPNVLNKSLYIPKRYRSRKLPFSISRGYMDVDTYVINIPEGFVVEVLPEANKIISEFGEYKSSVVLEKDGSLKYTREFLLRTGNFPSNKYKEYRDFRRKIASNDNQKIVLVKK